MNRLTDTERSLFVLAIMVLSIIFLGMFLLVCSSITGCQSVPPVPKPPVDAVPDRPQDVVQKAMNLPWLLSMSVFGIAGGIVGTLFLPGPLKTLAIALAAFCAISLGLTLLVTQYAQWLILGTVVLCVGLGIWATMRTKKEMTVLKTAIPELVKTVELTKDKLTAEVKEHLFGKKSIPTTTSGIVSSEVQSASTQALVTEIRNQQP
jgi:lysylphosphatidylglycerol synthetase-like protein (DUF2156 family)